MFLYVLFGLENRAAAAWLLGALGATDWVDGYLARRLGQVSEFGKIFDPTVDRSDVRRGDRRDHHRRIDPALVRRRGARRAKSLVGLMMAFATLCLQACSAST